MQRILILGNAGSGKTYLARQLAEILNLELIHLDYHFWQPGWKKTERSVWQKIIQQFLKQPKWVMDGNYSSILELRLAQADTVIYLEENRSKCLWRCCQRYLRWRGRNRPDLQPGCPETLDWEFISWIWNFNNVEKPAIFKKLKKTSVPVIILEGKKEVAEYLQNMQINKFRSTHVCT